MPGIPEKQQTKVKESIKHKKEIDVPEDIEVERNELYPEYSRFF